MDKPLKESVLFQSRTFKKGLVRIVVIEYQFFILFKKINLIIPIHFDRNTNGLLTVFGFLL